MTANIQFPKTQSPKIQPPAGSSRPRDRDGVPGAGTSMFRTSPLGPLADQFADLPDGLTIAEEPFRTQLNLRADATGAAAAAAVLGIEPPTTPCCRVSAPASATVASATTATSTTVTGTAAAGTSQAARSGADGSDGVDVLWLGPDEWLVTAPAAEHDRLESDLRAALPATHAALVDVGGQRTTLRIGGPLAASVLAKGCSIDLDPAVNGAGSCVQTLLSQAGVVIIPEDQTGTDFRVLVRASFARYLAAWLLDAAVEYRTGPDVTAGSDSRAGADDEARATVFAGAGR